MDIHWNNLILIMVLYNLSSTDASGPLVVDKVVSAGIPHAEIFYKRREVAGTISLG